MKRHVFKTHRMVDELVGYFLRHGVKEFKIQADCTGDQIDICIEGVMTKPFDDIDDVVHLMNSSRVPEIEEYYENLLGGDFKGNDMNLLGAMVDRADVEIDGDRISMHIVRYK